MHRYSREQILGALNLVIVDSFGIDDDELPLPGEPIDQHLKRLKLWDDTDLLDLSFRCEKTFGFKAGQADWQAFFDGGAADATEWERSVAPKLTYEALADFVAERAPAVSFTPIEIAGQSCAPAGAFLAIREVVKRQRPHRERFAPSTAIRNQLTRHQLEELWRSLSWMSPVRPPELRTCWSDMMASGVFLWIFAMAATGFAFLCAGEPDLFMLFIALAFFGFAPYRVLRKSENPLPDGIVTFGDLARRIAVAETGSASR